MDVIMTLRGQVNADPTKTRAIVAKEAVIAFGDIGRYTAARRILLRMTSMSKTTYFEELRAGFIEGFERIFKHASEGQKTAIVHYLDKLSKQDFYPSYGSTLFIKDLIDETIFSFTNQLSIKYFERRLDQSSNYFQEEYARKLEILRTVVPYSQGKPSP